MIVVDDGWMVDDEAPKLGTIRRYRRIGPSDCATAWLGRGGEGLLSGLQGSLHLHVDQKVLRPLVFHSYKFMVVEKPKSSDQILF